MNTWSSWRGPGGVGIAFGCVGILLLTAAELNAATYYVRTCSPSRAAECSDQNNGQTPQTAWGTIKKAAKTIQESGNPGDVVIVGPGTYREGDISLRRSGIQQLPITFRGDASGASTGDPPGPVLVDVGLKYDTGFLLWASDVVVTGFYVTNARAAGIQVRRDPDGLTSNRAVVANNVIFSNGDRGAGRGVDLLSSIGSIVFNNLIYDNASVGVSVGGSDPGSRGVDVINNTIYGNGVSGVVVGEKSISKSTGAWLINNIIAGNGQFGIDVNSKSTCDYVGAYNLVTDLYGRSTPGDPSDIRNDPLFVAPAGVDGVLGGSGFADDNFSLSAVAAGQAENSPALDAGSERASLFGLRTVTTRTDGAADDGVVDLGFHRDNVGYPVLDTLPIPLRTLYVRATGRDGNDGGTPARALASIGRAIELARARTRIIVSTGTYREGNISPKARAPAGPIDYIADVTGEFTGDPAGRVLIDAGGADAGFNVVGRCSTLMDGFTVTNADIGIFVKDSANSIVRNNISFSNRRMGINVIDSNDVQVKNNLVYANASPDGQGGGGIQVGGNVGSHRVRIESNTVYGNGGNGILIGTGGIASTQARVRFNIIDGNLDRGIQLDGGSAAGVSGEGYFAEFNINTDGYAVINPVNCPVCTNCRPFGRDGCTQQALSDLVLDPLLVDPTGADGILGGDGFADDELSLSHVAAGQPVNSPAVDLAPVTAKKAGLSHGSTRSDGVADQGALDLGYHAPQVIGSVLYVSPTGSDGYSGLSADRPLRTITEALQRLPEAGRAILAPGTYAESNLRPRAGVALLGPEDGLVLIDAHGKSTVFDIHESDVTLRRLALTGATDAAVRVRADGAEITSCVVFSNADKGIYLLSGQGALLFNNLVYANGNTGIVVGGGVSAAEAATIVNNTIYGNQNRGLTIGLAASVASTGAAVANNLIAGNRRTGLEVAPASSFGIRVGYNFNDDGYVGLRPPPTDRSGNPGLTDPAGADRTLGGIGMADDAFTLQQVSAGQRATSPCVDAGLGHVSQFGLKAASTRRDGESDSGTIDIGYHYGVVDLEGIWIPDLVRLVCPGYCGPPRIDCNDDGVLTVSELIRGVNIALGRMSLAACSSFDANGDGRVTIDELVTGVRNVLG